MKNSKEAMIKELNASFKKVIETSNRLEESYNRLKIHADNLSRQLTLNKDFLDQLLASLTNAVIDFDRYGHIRRMNRSASELFKIKQQNATIDFLSKYIPDISGILKSSMPVLKKKFSFFIEGKEKTVLLSYFPTSYEEQSGCTVIFDDVTELEIANKKIKRQEQLAAIGQMASQLAHQLRNPLGSIDLFNSLLLDELKGDLRDVAINIKTAVLHMNQILTNLMNFAKDTKLFIEYCDLAELILDVLDEYKLNIEKNGIVVEKTLFHKRIKTDKLILKEIIANILSNAIDVSANSTVRIVMSESPLTIKITDKGGGIPKDIEDKIFDPFFTTKHQGNGLGLAIVKKYADLIGVGVKFETSAEGTTFYLIWKA